MAKVDVERRGSATIVWLNRPEVHNAIDTETARLLHGGAGVDPGRRGDAGRRGERQGRSVILVGSRPHRWRQPILGTGGSGVRTAAVLGARSGQAVDRGVEGYCFAGGLELACWCDFRIAGATAEFGVLNRRWGIPLVDGGTQRLPRIVGLSNACGLIETGMRIDAGRAREIGLVQEVVPAGRAMDRALELAERMVQYPQASLAADRSSALAAHGVPPGKGWRSRSVTGSPRSRIPSSRGGWSATCRATGRNRPVRRAEYS